MENAPKIQKDDNILKTKRILKPKDNLNGTWFLHLAGQGIKLSLFPPIRYSTARNTLNI